jgi:hypothetical protein
MSAIPNSVQKMIILLIFDLGGSCFIFPRFGSSDFISNSSMISIGPYRDLTHTFQGWNNHRTYCPIQITDAIFVDHNWDCIAQMRAKKQIHL